LVNEAPRSPLSSVLETVRGLFTPKKENKSLENMPSTSNLQQDTDALFDDSNSESGLPTPYKVS
jgi:hypothetical protein